VSSDRLDCGQDVAPLLSGALSATTWQAREGHIVSACEAMARMHNELAMTPPLEPTARFSHDLSCRVIGADRFVETIDRYIQSLEIRAIIEHAGWIGGLDHLSDSVDLKTRPELATKMNTLYEYQGTL